MRGCDKKPYPGGTLIPQSIWPDAAQQEGTGTAGEKGAISTISLLGELALGQYGSAADTSLLAHAKSYLAAPQCLAKLAQELLQVFWGHSLVRVPGPHGQREHILQRAG